MLLFALALAACGVGRADAAAIAVKLPVLTGRVVDNADILPPEAEQRIAARSDELERLTGHQFVVVTLPSLEGRAIEAMGLALGNGWKLGRASVNDGVMLIVAPAERTVRIEVGCGLETTLTDAEAGVIIRQAILPAFRQGDFAKGIESGVEGVLREIEPEAMP